MYVLTQTVRHRDFFLPVTDDGDGVLDDDEHADPPTGREALLSLGLLLLALIAVVGLAKVESPAIEAGIAAVGLPPSFVGVVIALLVLLPETLASVRAARRNLMQTSLNLAYGSALASIGLTIPVVVAASVLLELPLRLGLDAKDIALLTLTFLVSPITLATGRTNMMPGGVHLVIFAAFLFLALVP
jgi:Ca2+:H+ antiporter